MRFISPLRRNGAFSMPRPKDVRCLLTRGVHHNSHVTTYNRSSAVANQQKKSSEGALSTNPVEKLFYCRWNYTHSFAVWGVSFGNYMAYSMLPVICGEMCV